MDTHKFIVESVRFHQTESDTLVFVGWFYDGTTKNHTLTALFDGEELPVIKLVNKGIQVYQKYIHNRNEIKEEVVGIIKLPKNWKTGRKLMLISAYYEEKRKDAVFLVRKLLKLQNEIQYYIENCHKEQHLVAVSGWCMGDGEIKLSLLDEKKQPLLVKTEHYCRRELLGVYPDCSKDAKPGFLIHAQEIDNTQQKFYLELKGAESRCLICLRKWDKGTRIQRLAEMADGAMRCLVKNGLPATVRKIHKKLSYKDAGVCSYAKWRKKYMVSPKELKQQQETKFTVQPVFSVVVPVCRTNLQYLCEMIESVRAQTYAKWQLCLADGSGNRERSLEKIVLEYQKNDKRIQYRFMPENPGLAENTNAAVEMAVGDYIVLMDHDDLMSPDALYEFAAAVEKDDSVDVLYSDEDKIDLSGKKYSEPNFKPDYSPDYLCSFNYISHLFAVKRTLFLQAGGFADEYDGAQDYDLILRCCEQAQKICHVPKILYHWRSDAKLPAANPMSSIFAAEAGRQAIEAHYARLGIPAQVENAQLYGTYRTVYCWTQEPLVSVIIPNKDHAKDLVKCIYSICEKSDYRNFEIIIVEISSEQRETFACYRKLESEYDNFHVITYRGSFNYSKIYNFGAAAAKGEYLFLSGSHVELINKNCIREMLFVCMRSDVGVVGAKLLDEEETILHAGVVIGPDGACDRTFVGKSRYDTGYFGRIMCAQDYSAVTAVLMTKRSVYEQVGGMADELPAVLYEIDFCLKVRQTGKLVVYNPYAELFCHEPKLQGCENSSEKAERFRGETVKLQERWGRLIEKGDPYYNPNLALDKSDFSLRN